MVTDHARLAKRISAVTTRCLLTAVVLVAGLGFGRQVLRWWAEDAAESADVSRPATIADGLGDPSRLHVLHFGEQPWSLRRQSIGGTRRVAAAALREICREVVRNDRSPDERPGEAEATFLGRLAARDPAEQEPGKWRLYELDEGLPMVVGTQSRAAANAPPNADVSAAGHRVIVWGLALPVGREAWSLFTFQPEVAAGGHAAALPEVPIPPQCRRTVSMRVTGGGGIVAFEGPPEPNAWIRFYDRWFATHNWKTAGGWQQSGQRWHVRYDAPGPAGRWEVDVHFGSHGPGHGTGLLIMTPSPKQRGPESAAASLRLVESKHS